jgi:hypothetical protein
LRWSWADVAHTVSGRRLNLDDIGAHVAEDLRGEGPQQDGGQIHDPYTVQWSVQGVICTHRWFPFVNTRTWQVTGSSKSSGCIG